MIRRPPRSTLDRSSAASDVYKRQLPVHDHAEGVHLVAAAEQAPPRGELEEDDAEREAVSYTHLRAHETVLDLVCRLLLEKKKNNNTKTSLCVSHHITDTTSK